MADLLIGASSASDGFQLRGDGGGVDLPRVSGAVSGPPHPALLPQHVQAVPRTDHRQ